MAKLELLRRQIAKLKAETQRKQEIVKAEQELRTLKREKKYGKVLEPIKRIGRGFAVMGRGLKKATKGIKINQSYFK